MTAVDVRELLPLHALGVLDDAEAELVERAIDRDPTLASELALLQASATELVAPVAPSPHVFDRLMASVGGGRFERMTSRMASLFEVTVDRARELLALIERPASWEPALPGIALVHFEGGARYATADCGFVRLDVGATFPEHSHGGEERCVILSGQLRDSHDGRVLSPGDEVVQYPNVTHHLVCVGDEPCIYAALAVEGITMGGYRVTPPGKSRP